MGAHISKAHRELALLITHMQENSDILERNILEIQLKMKQDAKNYTLKKPFEHQEQNSKTLKDSALLFQDLFSDLEKVKLYKHPQAEIIDNDIHELHTVLTAECAKYQELYNRYDDIAPPEPQVYRPHVLYRKKSVKTECLYEEIVFLESDSGYERSRENILQLAPNEEQPKPMEDTEGRLLNTQWCQCGHCKRMPTVEESVCCYKFYAMYHLLQDVTCVTDHYTFKKRTHSREFLMELLQFTLPLTQEQFAQNENRYLRLACYRNFTNLVHGFLGEGNRILLPSCVINKIRETYPDPTGAYTSFSCYADHAAGGLPTHLNY